MPELRDPVVPATGSASELVERWSRGDKDALAKLIPLVYFELKRLASGYMRREQNAGTLQTTALIHEAYIRLVGGAAPALNTRTHFFAYAARVMRNVLVDHARMRRRLKRGGGAMEIPLDEASGLSLGQSVDLLALDQALERLAEFDERKARVVEMRYFAGLEVVEVAMVLGVSENTIIRDWALARAWLQRTLSSNRAADE
jgi:RNA polymerase sigma factor (TIGR02999 family)